ncbi:MAG: hypothetical protein ABW104_04185 [Candidatus Thiodiazotropha sp. 6PLUC2]
MNSEIDHVRQYRSTLNSIADYILTNEKSVVEFGNSLEWNDLENIPTWLLWDKNNIDHLVMTAGTIFLLPSIRIWIDSKKIREVSDLIGNDVFKFIMNNTHVNNQRISSLNITNVSENIKSAGASVLLSCYSIRLRPWLSHSLPKTKGKLNSILAQEILKHTLFVLENTKNKTQLDKEIQ